MPKLVVFCSKDALEDVLRGKAPFFWSEYHIFSDPAGFGSLFSNARGRYIQRLLIVSHGQPGAIHAYGTVIANAIEWRRARGTGLDAVFAPRAVVRFGGCNVAAGDLGWEFLEEFGRTFLRAGGTVQGSTATMIGIPYIGPFPVPWGAMKFVKVKPGGLIESR